VAFRLRRSLDRSLADDFGDIAHRPFVAVEHVTRTYTPVEVKRIQRAMAVFGGLGVGYTGTAIDEDDDEYLDDEDEVEERETADSTTVALDDVSLVATGGTCVALVGPANAGKTTLLRIIAGLAPPSSGRVVVHGSVAPALEDLFTLYPRAGRLDGALTGLGALLGLPVRRIHQRRTEIFELYGQAGIGREPVSTAPRRTKKDLLLAMMLCLDTDILLMDFSPPKKESNKPRDDRIRDRLQEIRRSGSLIIMAAHDVESVAWIADRVIFMKKGSIMGDCPIEEALAEARGLKPARGEENA
jgi:ABC-type polysaccharide/polyol phosphate transport system ATPase subunit